DRPAPRSEETWDPALHRCLVPHRRRRLRKTGGGAALERRRRRRGGGMIAIKRQQGLTLVQDPRHSAMPFLPRNALLYDHVDAVLPVSLMAPVLLALAAGRTITAPSA